MAVETKKSESAADPAQGKAIAPDPKSEIAGLEAELATLRRNYNVLDTAHKRAQKKIGIVEEENRLLKKGETPKEVVPPQTVQPSVVSTDTNAVETPAELTREHISDWSPPYCADCGTSNVSFRDEVECTNCKAPLGSEKYAKHNMKICPMCGQNAGFKPRKGYTSKHDGCTGPECNVKA